MAPALLPWSYVTLCGRRPLWTQPPHRSHVASGPDSLRHGADPGKGRAGGLRTQHSHCFGVHGEPRAGDTVLE